MKISNFSPDYTALLAGGVGTIVSSSAAGNESLVLHLTNQSGAIRTAGDVVVIDTSTNESFTTSTTSNATVPIGVVDESIGVGSNGRVVVGGYAAAVSTLGLSVRGDYLYHSTTSNTAAHMFGTAPSQGAFGYVLAGGSNANTRAHIFPTVGGSTISAASNTTDVGSSVVVGGTGKYSDGAHVHRGLTSISHTSNTFYGGVTLTASGGLGITKPSEGTLNLSAPVGSGGGGGGSVVGAPVILVPTGSQMSTGTFNSGTPAASTAHLTTFFVPATMYVRSLIVNTATGHTGTCQWGLFDASSSATSCTKLAGGSGALSSSNAWNAIAASGAPVTVQPGFYYLILHYPAANIPAVNRQGATNTVSTFKTQASYTWDDTPDVTTGWTSAGIIWIMSLIGDINGTGTTW